MALDLSEGTLLHSTLNGDRRSLGKLISKIESGFRPDIPPTKTWTLGVTGPPGVGKSTLIGTLTSEWLKKRGKSCNFSSRPHLLQNQAVPF